MKLFLFCGIFVICVFVAKSQTISDENNISFDSTYNNYLYNSRLDYFKGLPVSNNEIIFIGNSITHWGDWAELLNSSIVRNRGIAGDISYGVLARISEVTNRRPAKVFIMIGVNDIGRKVPLLKTINNYEKILLKIKQLSPATKVFVQSVLPINESLINRQYYTGTNREILRLNSELRKLASKHSVLYIDLHKLFIDATGQMEAKYTYDGIHLSAAGYLTWARHLVDYKYCCN